MQCTELGRGKGYLFNERYTKVGYVFCQKWPGLGAWTSGRSVAVQTSLNAPRVISSNAAYMNN